MFIEFLFISKDRWQIVDLNNNTEKQPKINLVLIYRPESANRLWVGTLISVICWFITPFSDITKTTSKRKETGFCEVDFVTRCSISMVIPQRVSPHTHTHTHAYTHKHARTCTVSAHRKSYFPLPHCIDGISLRTACVLEIPIGWFYVTYLTVRHLGRES